MEKASAPPLQTTVLNDGVDLQNLELGQKIVLRVLAKSQSTYGSWSYQLMDKIGNSMNLSCKESLRPTALYIFTDLSVEVSYGLTRLKWAPTSRALPNNEVADFPDVTGLVLNLSIPLAKDNLSDDLVDRTTISRAQEYINVVFTLQSIKVEYTKTKTFWANILIAVHGIEKLIEAICFDEATSELVNAKSKFISREKAQQMADAATGFNYVGTITIYDETFNGREKRKVIMSNPRDMM
jgi:hypothetical protein